MADMTMLEAALSYARMGMAVFPLVERSKRPATANGFKNATTDEAKIRSWWGAHPEYNVGIACGNGLAVIDIDLDEAEGENGFATVVAWEREHGPLPETARALTGDNGMHLFYGVSEEVRNDQNKRKGIDIRGDGGYIVAPPSIHPDTGTAYAWEKHPDECPIAAADENVMAFIAFAKTHGDGGSEEGGAAKLGMTVPGEIGKGERNNTIFKLACSLQSKGLSDSAILAAAMEENAAKCDPPLPSSEVRKTVKSALDYAKGDAENPEKIKVALTLNDKGKPHQSITNAKKVLERDDRLAGRFKFNTIAYTKTVTLPVPWDDGVGERPVEDWDYIGLASYMERKYGLMSKGKAEDAMIEVAMHNKYNPVTEWLDSLEWDGVPRIDTLLPCFLGTDMSDYNVAVMRLFMQGAVARAYSPGTKFDYMPVLIGPQGLGKSYFLRKLGHCSDWYQDNMNTVEGDKACEKLRGMWIVEMAELLATKRQKDVESVKAFVTSQVDIFRPAYGKETQIRPRACVFAGTTNSPQFLTDTTGNRRFLPVECGVHESPMSLFAPEADEYFEQAWAEAVHARRTECPPLVLDDRLLKYAIDKQEQYMEDDPRIGIIQDYLDTKIAVQDTRLAPSAEELRVCAQEIIDEALPRDQAQRQNRTLVNEIHTIMQTKIEGWVKYPKNKGRAMTKKYGVQRCYMPETMLKDD